MEGKSGLLYVWFVPNSGTSEVVLDNSLIHVCQENYSVAMPRP